MEFSNDFINAIRDYFDLLNKNYPQKTVLEIVGNRYKLSRTERSILYRGVSSKEENTIRKEKLVDEKSVENQPLHIDGFNQILTIASYLNGSKVFISTDGFLRDASEIHSKMFRSELLERSIRLIFTSIDSLKLNGIVLHIDRQLNNHEQMEDYFSSNVRTTKIDVIFSDKVDQELKKISDAIIATSDSQIIKKSRVNIFDFPRYTLKCHFNPKFTDLKILLL